MSYDVIACAHGTRSPEGQRRLADLVAELRRQRPEVTVHEAYVDVQHPELGEVVARLPQGRRAVIVPLLLSVGFHLQGDIARVRGSRPGLLAAAPLGPDDALARLLIDVLIETAAPEQVPNAVVLAAAGSSVPEAAAQAVDMAGRVAAGLANAGVPAEVTCGFGASASPSVGDAVAALRAGGARRVAIASYLLAPGFFHGQLGKAGADSVSPPLLGVGETNTHAAQKIAELAWRRAEVALQQAEPDAHFRS